MCTKGIPVLLGFALLALLPGIPTGQDEAQASTADRERGPIPPEEPEEWKVVVPKRGASADTVTLKKAEQGYLIENTIVQASTRTAFICYQGEGPYRGTIVRNSILRVEPKTLRQNRSYWGVRAYDMIDTLFERVEITGFGVVTPDHDEGHAIYMNLAGSLTLVDSDIHHNGGQGIQLVNRPHESVLPRGPAKGTISIRNTRFRENGFNPDRGGFQVTIFGTGQDILMDDVWITAGHDETRFPGGKTGGALVIEAEYFRPGRPKTNVWWRPNELPEDFEMPYSQGTVILSRLHVDQRRPNKPIVQIKGCEKLLVQGCNFVAGRIDLDLPDKPGRECGSIVWKGNTGEAIVHWRGRRLGPASEDFEIRP